MPYLIDGDTRAHLKPEEKVLLSRLTVEFVRNGVRGDLGAKA